MLAEQVDQYLRLPKTLMGAPVWVDGTRPNQKRLDWPLFCEGVGEGPSLFIKYRIGNFQPSFSISLMVPPPVFRLDVNPVKEHVNRRPPLGVPRLILGSGVHEWADNKPAKGVIGLPRKLTVSRPYTGPEDLAGAILWVCEKLNITANASMLPEPPVRTTLF